MANLMTVRLNKGDSPNWGFRLQGGKDFGTPLVIQKVNGGSPAERAGLIAGDSVIKINNVDVYNLLHKEAQDVIVRSGSNFDMVIQRGGSTWKPSVIPTGQVPKPNPAVANLSPVTKTSLAAQPGEDIGAIGTGHNLSAKPFAPQVNGAVNGTSNKLINKQYNTPIKLYSEHAIAETLSAQTEVLSTGALGVNFKKNEKDYDATNSAVYRMLKEAENDPEPSVNHSEPDSGIVTSSNKGVAGLRHVTAPQNKPAPANPQLPPGQNICADCERLIVGVFVRIKDKNLHVECFKCATCGTSLKNVGYYNINNKLYCDIHAKSAAIAINNPAAVPVTIPPGGKAPVSAISAALSSHSLPSPSPLSPKLPTYAPSYPPPVEEPIATPPADVASKPFTPSPQLNSTAPSSEPNPNISSNTSLYNPSAPLSFSKFINKSAASSGPKPFSSVSAPLSPGGTLPRAAPLSPQSNFNRAPLSPPSAPSYSSYSPASTAEHASIVCHTNQSEIHSNPDETCHDLRTAIASVPVYSEINITIPHSSVNSPSQLDSHGSSPNSDFSSYSSTSSSKSRKSLEMAKEKVIEEINKSLMPKLKRVNLSETQSPRLNFVINNVQTRIENDVKRVRSELIIPVNNNNNNSDDKIVTENNLPDHLTFTRNAVTHEDVRKVNITNTTVDETKLEGKNVDPHVVPVCWKCQQEIVRGPFITALGKIWCPQHFVCATPSCKRSLQDLGFVEEQGQLYCEYCFEQYLAPPCSKCNAKIKTDCLKAIGKNFHPECFNCYYCGKLFGNAAFFLEDGNPYCEADWNELFTTKCFACGFPVEAGDRWVEALNNNYHSQCFNCTMCKKNLEGQSFFAKGGRPFCKNHAR